MTYSVRSTRHENGRHIKIRIQCEDLIIARLYKQQLTFFGDQDILVIDPDNKEVVLT